MTLIYPRESNAAHPPRLFPGYKSTPKRSPQKPLILMRQTLSELTGPVYGHETVRPNDNDLTIQHKGEPLGERIIVHGHVRDEDGRGVPNTLLEIWQANACGRYVHRVDQHDAPLDPNFLGAGRCLTDNEGRYRFLTIKPGAYPTPRGSMRPSHIHFEVFGKRERLITQLYFAGDPHQDADTWLRSSPNPDTIVMPVREPAPGMEPEEKLVVFDIVLMHG